MHILIIHSWIQKQKEKKSKFLSIIISEETHSPSDNLLPKCYKIILQL